MASYKFMLMISISIIIASIIWSGLNKLMFSSFIDKPFWASTNIGIFYINLYKLFILPMAALNGYSLSGYKGFFIVGIGTILGKLLVQDLLKNNHSLLVQSLPTISSVLFGAFYIIFTIYVSFIY